MSVTRILDPLPGEDIVAIQPNLSSQVTPGWLHRLSLFNGRALTAPALQSEQAYRAGRLTTLGQSVTQGVVKGLQLSADLTATDPLLQVTPGYGISATGEDVALMRTLRTTLSALQVIDAASGAVISAFPAYTQNPANSGFAGILLLQPITAQVSGASIDTGSQPLIVSGNLATSCGQDPSEYAFQDWQIVDGVRLVFVAWPSAPASLAIPASAPSTSWRNRLAYSIFNSEISLVPDDRLPWDLLGVPLALIGFDNTWRPLFIDRSAVVRAGGLPRTRYVFPAIPGVAAMPSLVQPALAQARIAQLSEQVSSSTGLNSLVPTFALLPPCGILPAAAMDFTRDIGLWFPSTWTLTVAPVLLEEVESALLSGMTAQPLDASQNETVEVLVPLPDAVYDPKVLVVEKLDPAFQNAVTSAQNALAATLQRRKVIQFEGNALFQALNGPPPPALYDIDAGLTSEEMGLRDAQTYTPAAGESFDTADNGNGYLSNEYNYLISTAQLPPYTLTLDGNGNPLPTPLQLFSADDIADLGQNGIQHFISRINAKLAKANDLIDLAFLTAQSDIYRFRQYIMGATDATALAVSPIAAEIATGESAVSTAANLENYLTTVLPSKTPAPSTTAPPIAIAGQTGVSSVFKLTNVSTALMTQNLAQNFVATTKQAAALSPTAIRSISLTDLKATTSSAAINAITSRTFTPATPGTIAQPASPADVQSQSPIVGAQLNLRTLSVARRLANPPSQEGLFYAVGNRYAILNLLADLEITIDDIPILLDTQPQIAAASTSTTAPPSAVATTTTQPPMPQQPTFTMPLLGTLRSTADAATRSAVLNAVLTPQIQFPPNLNPDEASLFSAGIRVLEQHSALLRAIEARIQQYNDFLNLCSASVAKIQSDLSLVQGLIQQLENNMTQQRQDLAFTSSLLSDEQRRIANVNTQRAQTLKTYVQVVAFTRPRTLKTEANVPSRQLVPGNVASPVPTCLQSTQSPPPELREIVNLLREAPVNWLPATSSQIAKLQTPTLLIDLGLDVAARASSVLTQTARVSSAANQPGAYAYAISAIFSANQTAVRPYITQRASFQIGAYSTQSWASLLNTLQNYTSIGDLIASSSVPADIVNSTSRILAQISSVATCLYSRANQALPIARLGWAEFLSGPGVSIQMQSLAVLPNWNTQDYIYRQQTQMLVDWLFQQIDTANSNAVAFMSDLVRTSILLASDSPADTVIAGAVSLAVTPKQGTIIHLNLPSERITQGMYVKIYSAGALTAQAVVSDLDSSSVRATITDVYRPNVTIQPNDVAHFTAAAPYSPAIRPFMALA